MLRSESARHDADGRPIVRRAEDDPRRQYQIGMGNEKGVESFSIANICQTFS
jgi:hypothetical protein